MGWLIDRLEKAEEDLKNGIIPEMDGDEEIEESDDDDEN